MANECVHHAGRHNAFRRGKLDGLMQTLSENQSGEGRRKCPYCAYERGYLDGLRQAGDALRTLLPREASAATDHANR